MARTKGKSSKSTKPVQKLSAVIGNCPVLPGESAEEYQQGLNALIEELEAKTVMQVYLAEKIFQCLWWMRRYEQQKRVTIAREMARIIRSGATYKLTSDEAKVLEFLLDPNLHDEFERWLAEKSVYTVQSLQQEAFANKSSNLSAYNEQITVMAKNLSGLHASYEVLVNRKLSIERLRMQNELLSQDLRSIEVESTSDESQSPKKSSK